MLGGGHVRGRSLGSIIEASPCVRVRGVVWKRKRSIAAPLEVVNPNNNLYDSGSVENARYYRAPSNREYGYDNTKDNNEYEYALDSPRKSKAARVVVVAAAMGGVDGNVRPMIAADIRPAIASALTSTSASPFGFGSENMIRVQAGLRPSSEEGCLTTDRDGKDIGMSMSVGGGDARTSSFLL